MPQAPAFYATPLASTTYRGIGAVLRKLPVGVVILAVFGILATATFDRDAVVADGPRLVPAPSAAPMATAGGDPSVPDASTVFRGHDVAIKEPLPTF